MKYSVCDLICDVVSSCVGSCDITKINVYDKIVKIRKKENVEINEIVHINLHL